MTVLDEASPQGGSPVAHPQVSVLTDRCAGCQECVIRCPTGALTMDTTRWVAEADEAACVGCRQCVRTCPFSAIVVSGPVAVAERHDVPPVSMPEPVGVSEVRGGFSGWAEALAEADRCLSCPDPTCVRGCPTHNDIPGFIAALKRQDLEGAHDILSRTTVMPDICSRVCNQAAQCEGACTWSLAGAAPVAIGRLERFVADHEPVPVPRPGEPIDLSVAIVGSGPAAVGAAFDLLRAGARVTVYEKDPVPGGLIRWGIPDFTLPAEVASRPWRDLEAAGVEVRTGHEVRPEELSELARDHDAVVLANGAGVSMRPRAEGLDLAGVVDATSFLKAANEALAPGGDPRALVGELGLSGRVMPRVLVLGAGNTAMDVARSARRLSMSPLCIDWMDERFALARPDELEEARHEGVEIRFCTTLRRLEGERRVERAELAATVQRRADRPPSVLEAETETIPVDLVVMAMGYRADQAFAPVAPGTPLPRAATGLPDRRFTASGILAGPASPAAFSYPVGRLALGRERGVTLAALAVQDRTWVVGDALVGPSTVVEAMAQGRRAAAAILRARPARPGRSRPSRSQVVLVCYESRGGRTEKAAEALAAEFSDAGHRVRTLPIGRVGPLELANADVIVIGTWVEGLVVAKVGPAKAMADWLAALPRLGGKTVGIFCTFSVAPRGTLPAMRRVLQDKGADVVAQAAFGPGELGARPTSFGPAGFAAEIASRLAGEVAPGLAGRQLRTVGR